MQSLWMQEQALPSGLSPLKLAWLFGSLIAAGLALNFLVIYKTLRLARRDPDQFKNGTGVYLFVMAFADVFSLLSIFTHMTLSYMVHLIPLQYASVACKMFVFVSRAAYMQSSYCWLFMSGLRYLAACKPLLYSTVWRSPAAPLATVLCVSTVINLHVFGAVFADEQLGCVKMDDSMTTIYSIADAVASYLFPSTLIFIMDIKVLCERTRRKSSDPLLQIVFHKLDEETEKKRATNMKRFMGITLVSLLISAPDAAIRALRAIVPDARLELPVALFLVCQSLYFFKASFNAFYLTSYVFDRNVLSKTSSSRQLSISARRLEESPNIITRERSHTVSYRATTPVPLLTRNSSCILLDQCESPTNWL
ncbi:hypothetical protein PFISCL1PPCAC_16545 [Pristionchus fissidentatus]|uniref:G-protein coupled receptors family 1 profile domain-containing protein n=1 Tax=Pristionchus fissidentatus TaxID=1538716 RepID=A0AAV5W0Y3_9BILA|nr:hypothetical protein PFISCL1PPCAC_16545 [Pristionchus fissidentatus]